MFDVKKILIVVLFSVLIVLPGCSAKEKAALVNWMHELYADQTEVYFWSQPLWANPGREAELTTEEEQKLIAILSSITEENVTWNKRLAGITPEYGFHLIIGDDAYYINQAGAPHGQTEICFEEKQWWIESAELFEFMKSHLDAP